MRIGIFDSGVGGLIIAKAVRKTMPEYDYVYLGDTKRVPYGNRSHQAIFEFTKEGVDYLFRKENCAIVIIACNTASARALRRIQKEYTPSAFGISPLTGGELAETFRTIISGSTSPVGRIICWAGSGLCDNSYSDGVAET